MTLVVSFSIVFSFGLMKSMNALMINEDYAKGLGIKVNYLKIKMIVLSSLMAGIITAYAGPIAFIGVAIPHLARNFIHTSDHRKTLPIVLLLGSNMMLICDLISQLPGGTTVLPINSVTALFGAPIVIWIVIKNRSFLNS
jgi:iron complex transport system permease protein